MGMGPSQYLRYAGRFREARSLPPLGISSQSGSGRAVMWHSHGSGRPTHGSGRPTQPLLHTLGVDRRICGYSTEHPLAQARWSPFWDVG